MDFSPEDNDQLFADAEYIESNICKKHLKVHCDYCSRMKDAEMEILFDEGENTLLYQCAQSVEEKMDNESGKPKTGGKTVQCSVCFARFKKNEDLVKHKEEHAKERGTPDEAVPSTSHFSHDTSQQEGCGDESVPSSSPLSHDTSQQEGCGDEDAYEIHLKSSKTFKNKAMENVYGVTFNEKWRGQRLLDIHANLMKMFEDVIREATRGMDTKDLGRVVNQHPDVEPIVVSLRPIGELTPSCVLEYVMKVLNSHQELALNVDFRIDVGVIDIPKGGKRLHFTQLRGDNNSLSRKKAIVEIVNDDNLCLARAIAVCWAKQNVCPRGEWRKITKERKGRSNLQLILDTGKMPSTHYENLRKKNSREQRELAAALTSKVGLPLDRPCTITDISVFEDVLHLRILVIDSALGNRFCRIGAQSDRPCIFLYLVDGNHFHAINTITGFFSNNYFCMKCLKPYSNVAKHACGGPCLICKRSDECVVMDDPVSCRSCRMECRSMECFQYHKLTPEEKGKRQTLNARDSLSECSKYWRCIKCHKTVDRRNRNLLENPHECGEWTCKNCTEVVFGNHRCYMRSLKKEIKDKFFIFFDFECDQSSPVQCRENYLPKEGSRVCQHCSTDWCGRNQHKPNFVVAHTSCSACQEKPIEVRCKNCGTRCKKCEKKKEGSYIRSPCADTCGNREMVFKGYESAVHFGRWLFQEKHFGAKVVAHNLQGYDGTFILRYLVDNCMTPTHIIYNGSKIMSMYVGKGLHIRLVDSLNFLPMSLKKLPKTFSLTAEDEEIRKGYFPHFFNTIENQNYIGEYPAPQDYGMNSMNVEDRHDFLKWYKEKKSKGAIFDFAKEIEAYCRDDVTILRKACLKFRELIFTQTNNEVDAFDSVTIASMCMTIFRTCFLPEEHRVHLVTNTDLALPTRWVNGHGEVRYVDRWLSPKDLLHTHNLVVECRKHQGDEDVRVKKSLGWHTYLSDKGVRYEDRWYSHADLQEMSIREHEREFVKSPIALIPAAGYRRLDNYSKESIEWLEWVMEKNKKQGKLEKIQHALNGGEVSLPSRRICFDGYCRETNTVYEFLGCRWHGCPVCMPNERDKTRLPGTRQTMIELYYLTKIRKQTIENAGYKYVSIWEHDFQSKLKENEQMRRFVNSLDLQPPLDARDSFYGGRTNAIRLHHEVTDGEFIRYVDFTSLYPWTNKTCRYPVGHPDIIHSDFSEMKDYFGIALVKMLPPRKLFFPVLPYKNQGKLKFPLCKTCADQESKSPCQHTDEQRCLLGTWTTPEIMKAMEKGYTVVKMYEVYHWPETTMYDHETNDGGLFARYINTFLKYKQEASDIPAWCRTTDQKKTYIESYFQKEGVRLDWDAIEKNPGLRAVAKLCLNSFWGKFGQRLNLTQVMFFYDNQMDEFFQMLTDPTKQVLNFEIVNDHIVQVSWIHVNDFVDEDTKTNIFLATFTTSWARLKLYDVLDQLKENVLYHDTDSVIYIERRNAQTLSLGDYLGELTDELEGHYIEEFVSGGPKNYAYRRSDGQEVCKVRGFSLNYENSKLVNFDAIKGLLFSPNEDEEPSTKKRKIELVDKTKIVRNRPMSLIYNREQSKKYQVVYTKRVVKDDMTTIPYGF